MIWARISNEREMSTPETYAWRCEGVSKPAPLNDLREPGTAKEGREVTRNVKYALNVDGNAKSQKAENYHVSMISRTKLRL